ncbi:poly polymerase catalytic subunit [Sea otter poxvirus]|uniref:Poly(A) polymerase catalytic subunit n=1 Tax=Sea otter poxvirus TaxID=1416741 RepID=A0A2U9QHI8_9POXV|nr:poly polymerase catalytic subunit [Sea otter poxvirus]AWU47070.1 poly polymerase catalytic subunit [Sea otter poxvirus]
MQPKKAIISAYIGKEPDISTYYILSAHSKNIYKIMRFDKMLFTSLLRKNKRRFFPHQTDASASILAKRVNDYFNKQKTISQVGRIVSIIELQYVLVTTYTHILGVLTMNAPSIYMSNPPLQVSCMNVLAQQALTSYNVATPSDKPMGRHHTSDLVDSVNHLVEEYLRRHNKSCICYGSYSLHLLNSNIQYCDIDIVQTNSRIFLINMAFLLYFITGRHVTLLKVPFLKQYTVLHDEDGGHILDSFNIRQSTMNKVPKILVDNIYILDPILQLMAMLKMFSQIDRLEDIARNPTKPIDRLATLLAYVQTELCIVFDGIDTHMPLHSTIDEDNRIVTVCCDTLDAGFNIARVYLDENVLANDLLHIQSDNDEVDFESISNSVFLISDNILYTYFSNTILLSNENTVHDISKRALTAHIIMFLLLTDHPNARSSVVRLVKSLISDRSPIFKIINRDKKSGSHGIIDIYNDIISH